MRSIFLLMLLAGCAGTSRMFSSCNAEMNGADWVVVQLDMSGYPFRCWKLNGVSIANEPQSDGIYWEDPHGNLVHISGLYNRVQVSNGNWNEAFDQVGLTEKACQTVHDQHYILGLEGS